MCPGTGHDGAVSFDISSSFYTFVVENLQISTQHKEFAL